jgi:enolase
MSITIASVHAVEVLDSRARPTLAVTLTLSNGSSVRAGVPSGASTGSGEAVELRDGDPDRYAGHGVLGAVGNVNGPIAEALTGHTFGDLAEVDQTMRDLDGTPNKSRLGANAIVGVSMAAARGFAAAADLPPGV